MLPFLAQIAPQVSEYSPPAAISQWLECLFWFAAFVGTVVGVFVMLRPKPAMHEYVQTADFDARMDGMSRTSKEFRDAIRSEQTKQGGRLSAIEATQEFQNEKLNHMDAKLDRLIERQ